MYSFLILVLSIISVFLMIIILMQASKGDGLSGNFGAGSGMGTMFGTRRTADFLSKATWWLAGSIAVLAIVVNLFFLPGQSSAAQREKIIQGSGRQVPQTPSLPPQTSAPAQQNQAPKK
ncbi:MAG TPA: preprotein translocase subunit SecG [Ignavibacteriaceae bacterium]|nr:preprotein translocase subunit SecG [Ignavibacteriaceae bacterium]